MINESVARLASTEGQDVAVTEVGALGYAIFGPYTRFPPGHYTVTFQVSIDDAERALFDPTYPDELCGFFDVAIDGNRKIAHSNLFLSQLSSEPTTFTLPFHLAAEQSIETRVFNTGAVELRIDPRPTVQESASGDGDRSYILAEPEGRNAFVSDHFDLLHALHENGARIRSRGDGAVVSFKDVSVILRSSEDCQVADEVFVTREYAIASRTPKIAIDIGMNVGYASLALASDPHVLKVYAFEPFATPFERAKENFALNPALNEKIHPLRCGLGGADLATTVLVSETETIATSIHGRPGGRPETIEVREAASALSAIFAEAKALGADVIMKVDCEGSEFQIFDSLERAGLLGAVRAFMVEWHKRADGRKSLQHLVEPLIANGFVVFDSTRPSNLYAGHFRAVRIGA